MTFIVRFEQEAYETGWNYNAFQFALHRALPQQIKDVLCLAPKQTTYNGYKALVTQVNQHYWEDRSENMALWTPWNASGNTNWQAGATNSIRSSIPTNPANPAPRFPSDQGITSTNLPQGQRPPAQLNATDLHETPEPLDTNPNDHDDILDPANNQEALCANQIQNSPWINVPEETQEKQWKEVYGKRVSGLGLEDALDCRPNPDVFSALATLLRATILAPDNPPVHLPSHSSTNLLLRTTLPFTTNPVPTLVDSGATNNFIDEFLAALAPHPLRRLPALIPLKLFDGDPTPAGDITHCLETTMTFANGRQQELRLLITKLHPSTPVVLGFSWLCSTNPHIDWPSLTLRLDWDNPTNSGLSFIINVQLNDPSKVFPALVDSGASSTFVSNQLGLWHNDLDRPLELQLFDGSPAMTRIMQYHDNTLTLDIDLQFQAQLLITQVPPPTPIVLRLPWLQDVNPDIDWKDLTMQFPGPKVSLAAAIRLRLQSIPDSDISHPGASTSRATQNPSTSDDNPDNKGDATPPQSPSITL
ncbi:hypothetical protein E4T56_gene591 [Termitomyces sp. T112]|nr:hypothetical protein E4T56_gene591 [Termitomyces sp. T112]